MEIKKNKIKYEFYTYEGTATTQLVQTLVLNNPASVSFYNVSNNGNSQITINNVFVLNSFFSYTTVGADQYPPELILRNNIEEIDVTNYQIRGDFLSKLIVVCKYYI